MYPAQNLAYSPRGNYVQKIVERIERLSKPVETINFAHKKFGKQACCDNEESYDFKSELCECYNINVRYNNKIDLLSMDNSEVQCAINMESDIGNVEESEAEKQFNLRNNSTGIPQAIDRISNSYSSDSNESFRERQDSVATELGDEYAFLRQEPDSRWQSSESLQDDGEYCVLKPMTIIDGSEHGEPIYQIVEIKCQKSDGSEDNNDIYCYKETTILDANKTPRATTVSKFRVNSGALNTFVNTEKDKKEYIVDELVKTEEVYLESLQFVIKNYMEYLSDRYNGCPLRKYKFIFINIEMIYEESLLFLNDLKSCQYNYEQIGCTFIRYKNLFHRYTVYCKNKKKSQELISGEYEDVIKKREYEIDDKLGLNSYLLKPIQRLTKYVLLLKSLYKCLQNEGDNAVNVKEGIKLVKKMAKKGNDLIVIESIDDNPHCITDTGEFVMKDSFKLLSPKKMDIELFLFTKMIIFAINRGFDMYTYKTYIPMVNLYTRHKDLTIELEDFYMRKKHKDPKYVLAIKDAEIRDRWVNELHIILWNQLKRDKEKAAERERQNVDANDSSH